MMIITTVYLLVLLPALQACNPGQNSTSVPVPTPNTTSRPRPIPTTSSPLPPVEQLTPTESEEEYSASANCHNENRESDAIVQTYQHIRVTGLPFQRGQSHGRQAKDKILSLISFYKTNPLMPTWTDCVNFVRTNYLEALNHYCPNGLEEMKGIAEGAGVQLEDVLILNSKHELIHWKRSERMNTNYAGYHDKRARASSEWPECVRKLSLNISTTETGFTTSPSEESNSIGDEGADECTGAVALSSSTKYAHVLLGQNWDGDEFLFKNDSIILLEVHPDPCENIKPFVMLTEAGQLGNMGMSSDGLGVVAMSLWSSSDTFLRSAGRGWIPSSLLKRMFIESPNFSMGLSAILRAPIHISVNMIIATAEDEALNIELTPKGHFPSQVQLEKEFLAHSNHFKSASFLARNDIKDGSKGGTSLFRDRRVERHLMNAWPRITEETFQVAFKDHVGFPGSVCGHLVPKTNAWTATCPGKMTVASAIFNLSQRTLQVSRGPPCTEAYTNYCFKFSQL